MIRAEIRRIRQQGTDCFRLRISGHAGFDEPGKDIVCAAASILYYALKETLEEDGIAAVAYDKPGEAEIRAYGDCGMTDAIGRYFTVARRGFEVLSAAYPANAEFFYEYREE